MKAWILIAFYLWKDIWSRWFESPGGVFSRLLVAFLLALVMLMLHAAFVLSARSLEEKIDRLGVHTLLLTRSVSAQEIESGRLDLQSILAPLALHGELLALKQPGVAAQDDFGQSCAVAAFDDSLLFALAPLLDSLGARDAYLITDELPPAMPVQVEIEGTGIDAITVAPPAWLASLGSRGRVVLLPETLAEPWLEQGYLEMLLFLGNADAALELPAVSTALRQLLRLEGIQNAQLTSPEALISELAELRSSQRRWLGGFGISGGLVVALVFGSIAILEYRQNRYIVALLRSFGTPRTLLIARYLLEALVIVIVAAMLARSAASYVHGPLFARAGIEPGLLSLTKFNPYEWSNVWRELRGLGLGVLLSILPIVLALRTPVGKVLG
jgi:hypothetical protein